jgi:hypothetical protein
VLTIKPAERYKHNTKAIQIHKNGTLNKQNKNNKYRDSMKAATRLKYWDKNTKP